MEKKPEEVKKGAPEYMSTYGDFVTLLLCFFVLLFAFSTVDAAKFQAMAASFTSSPFTVSQSGGKDTIKELYGSGIMQMPSIAEIRDSSSTEMAKAAAAEEELQMMASDFKTYFAEKNIAEQVRVEVRDNETVLTFTEGILFDRGKANLKQEAIPVLQVVADELVKYPENDIQIEGHTDTDPIHTPQYPSNWYLSAARAIAVGTYLIDVKNFDPVTIGTSGKGEYIPVAPNDTAENKAKNRRVEIKVKSKYYSGNAFQ